MSSVRNDASDYNVAIGNTALQGGTGALIGNVAIGDGAMDSTSGNAQTATIAIGQDALTALTSGASNVVIGYHAATAATDNTANILEGFKDQIKVKK